LTAPLRQKNRLKNASPIAASVAVVPTTIFEKGRYRARAITISKAVNRRLGELRNENAVKSERYEATLDDDWMRGLESTNPNYIEKIQSKYLITKEAEEFLIREQELFRIFCKDNPSRMIDTDVEFTEFQRKITSRLSFSTQRRSDLLEAERQNPGLASEQTVRGTELRTSMMFDKNAMLSVSKEDVAVRTLEERSALLMQEGMEELAVDYAALESVVEMSFSTAVAVNVLTIAAQIAIELGLHDNTNYRADRLFTMQLSTPSD